MNNNNNFNILNNQEPNNLFGKQYNNLFNQQSHNQNNINYELLKNETSKLFELGFNTILDIQTKVTNLHNSNNLHNSHNSHNSNNFKQLSHNIICTNCNKFIKGFRYKCIICSNYELCELCEIKLRKKEITHLDKHLFLKIDFNVNIIPLSSQLDINQGKISLQFNNLI